MGMDGMVPNLTASEAVSPYRFVKVSGNMTGAHCASQTDIAIGVSDGSVSAFNTTTNASVGDPIQLQQGRFMQVQISAGCDAGDLLTSTTGGKALSASGADYGVQYHMVAAQTAVDADSVIWAFWRPTFAGTVWTDGTTITGDGTEANPIALV